MNMLRQAVLEQYKSRTEKTPEQHNEKVFFDYLFFFAITTAEAADTAATTVIAVMSAV